MDGRVGAAAALSESDRQELAVQALARAATVNDLAFQHGTSRKVRLPDLMFVSRLKNDPPSQCVDDRGSRRMVWRGASGTGGRIMEQSTRFVGMDVHKDTIVVAVTASGEGGKAMAYGLAEKS